MQSPFAKAFPEIGKLALALHKRPSELIGVNDPLEALAFDVAFLSATEVDSTYERIKMRRRKLWRNSRVLASFLS